MISQIYSIKKLSLILTDEDKAESFLIKSGILKAYTDCIYCGSSHLGRVSRGRVKCYACKSEWKQRKGSLLEGMHISSSTFIGCMKFFADGLNASRCAEELEVSPKLTRRLFNIFRQSLIPTKLRTSPTSNKITFTIRQMDTKIHLDWTASDNTENGKFASIYAVRSKDKDGRYCYNFEYRNKRFKQIINEIDKIDGLDDFYRFAKEHILKFRGRDMNSLIVLLNELTFRYNNRNENIFNLLLKKLRYH